MPDYRRMYDDKEHLYAYDLPTNQDVIVQIERCTAGELVGQKGRKSKKPMLSFVGKEKKLALNKTNGKTVARLYGKDTDGWAGQWVALYVSSVEYDGETMDCIRIRPQVPQRGNGKNARKFTNEDKAAAPKGQELTDAIADKMTEQSASGGGYVSELASKSDEGGNASE